jgi:hypothetical protein
MGGKNIETYGKDIAIPIQMSFLDTGTNAQRMIVVSTALRVTMPLLPRGARVPCHDTLKTPTFCILDLMELDRELSRPFHRRFLDEACEERR